MLDEVRHTEPWPRLYIVSRQTSDSERPKKMYRFGIQVDFGGLKAASVEATVMIGKGLPSKSLLVN